MKTLLLMRHAKSSWKDTHLADHERPLNKRGRRDAPRMGQLLVDQGLAPQLILSSDALRARQTAEVVAEAADFPGEVTYLSQLYMAEADEIIAVLRQTPDEIERVMLIGHNPGLETLLQLLSGRIESLPTAVVAHLSLPITSWAELPNAPEGQLVEIWRPKELREEEEAAGQEPAEHEKAAEKEAPARETPKKAAKAGARASAKASEKAEDKSKGKGKEKEKEKSKEKDKGKTKKKAK